MDVYQELFTKAADGIREAGGFSEGGSFTMRYATVAVTARRD